jgi:hypothetical protein
MVTDLLRLALLMQIEDDFPAGRTSSDSIRVLSPLDEMKEN